MQLTDLGYREWKGRDQFVIRPWIIARSEVRLLWRNMWLRRMLLLAWLPVLAVGAGFYWFERTLVDEELRTFVFIVLRRTDFHELAQLIRMNSTEARSQVWAHLLFIFLRHPQGVIMVLLLGFIGPKLIAQDMRSRAYLLYFSRPLTTRDYILGKLLTLWFFVSLIVTAPALALYVLGLMLSPQNDVVLHTWDLPLRILVASAVVAVPTGCLVLCLSSLSNESRYAGFTWFAIWIIGWVTYAQLTAVGVATDVEITAANTYRWSLFSLYHILVNVEQWAFGLSNTDLQLEYVWSSLAILTAITVVSLLILHRRVLATLRI